MTIRLQEVHPALVHFPIALLPTAIAADAIGELAGSDPLLEAGRRLAPIAAASAVVAGAAGLVAQAAVRTDGESHGLLVTHRNLNLGLTALVTVLALVRSRRARPGPAYLLGGGLAVGVMAYTAAIGGRMVYKHGVGVEAAGGLREERAPPLDPRRPLATAEAAVDNAGSAARHASEHLAEGEVAPAL